MRPSLVISLLLLSLLLSNVQGIRLDEGSVAVQQKKQQDEESALLKRRESGVEEALLCKDAECIGTMKKRVSRISRKSHSWIPSIHEDYYGPAHHRPRHH